MGGVILIFLLAMLIVILVTPAVRSYVETRKRLQRGEPTAHDAVISRLEDHRKRRNPSDRSDG